MPSTLLGACTAASELTLPELPTNSDELFAAGVHASASALTSCSTAASSISELIIYIVQLFMQCAQSHTNPCAQWPAGGRHTPKNSHLHELIVYIVSYVKLALFISALRPVLACMGQLDKAPKWATDWSSRGSFSSSSSSEGSCSLHSASDLSDEDFLPSNVQLAESKAADDCSAVGQLATGQSQYTAACAALRIPPSSSVLNKLSSEQLHITTMLSGGAGLALAKALAVNCCLRVLQLRNTNLGEAGCTAVAEALLGNHHRIAKLDLSGNMVSTTTQFMLCLHCCSY
jgi:hypothetical protein